MDGLQHIKVDGDALRRERERAGLKQAEAARALGVSRQLMCDYEYNRAVPPGDTLLQILTLYRSTADAVKTAA